MHHPTPNTLPPLPRTPFHPYPAHRSTPTPHTLPPLPPTLYPLQVVAKSCKMVPVMLMGYVVSGRRYTCIEYAMAA
jgi:hypothetical protein